MRNIKKIIITALLLVVSLDVFSQSVVLQVVSKKITKKFVYQAGDKLVVNGKKAEVEITTWDKDLIQLEFIVIAKHPDKSVAEADLRKMDYTFEKNYHIIVLDNSVDKSQGKPSSNLKAKYKLTIPANCPVDLTNYFGKNTIENLSNGVDIKSEFCEIGIAHLKGLINLSSKFGDIDGEDINGTVFIDANRSNIRLNQISGDFDIQAKYGIIKVFADQSVVNMNIKGDKSDVYFYNTGDSSFNFDLATRNGSIDVGDQSGFQFTEMGQNQKAIFVPSKEITGMKVKINVSFGDIRIMQ